jgi:hypothetical protein
MEAWGGRLEKSRDIQEIQPMTFCGVVLRLGSKGLST